MNITKITSLLLLFSHWVMSDSFATPWTVAHQAPLSIEFPRQEYWRGLPLLPLEDLPDTGIKASSFVSPALAGGFFTNSAMFTNTNQLKKKKKEEEWISFILNEQILHGFIFFFPQRSLEIKIQPEGLVFPSVLSLESIAFEVLEAYLKSGPGGAIGKESACQCRWCGFDPWVGKIPWGNGNLLLFSCL